MPLLSLELIIVQWFTGKNLMCILSQYLPAPPRKYCTKRNSLQYNKCQRACDNGCHSPIDCPFPICGNHMIRPQEEFLSKCLEIFRI